MDSNPELHLCNSLAPGHADQSTIRTILNLYCGQLGPLQIILPKSALDYHLPLIMWNPISEFGPYRQLQCVEVFGGLALYKYGNGYVFL